MMNKIFGRLRWKAQPLDLRRWFRWGFSLALIAFQMVLAWGIGGRFGILTAETGSVVLASGVWIVACRLFAVAIVLGPLIDAYLWNSATKLTLLTGYWENLLPSPPRCTASAH
ncbi:MAG: hypothetical protein AAF125_19390 [Chloroflexota bacterium]